MKKLILLAASFALLCSCASLKHSYVGESSEEEMVEYGYGRIKRSVSGYAPTKVDINEKELITYANMYDYLRGRVPGVSVGRDNSIVIRGIGSINPGTEPLILVDDVECTDLMHVDPAMVKSVDVIKDASSSIYGVRGANGVIIIRLKK